MSGISSPAPSEGLAASVYTPTLQPIPLKGAAPDLAPEMAAQQGYLTSSMNFLIRTGRVHQREGANQPVGATAPIGGVGQSVVSMFEWIPYNGSALMVAGGTRDFCYNTAADSWFDITSPTATNFFRNNIIDYCPMRTATSGLRLLHTVAYDDPPRWWSGDTASSFLYLTTSVMGACGITWRSHYLQGDTTDTADGHVASRVHWSALGDPTVWTGTASAGSIDLIDANASAVRRFLPLQQQLLTYKEEGVHTLTYKASPFYFTQQLLHPLITLLSPRAVCSVRGGDLHFVFTRDGAILWDGQTIQPIGRNRVDRSIINAMSWSNNTLTNAFFRPDTQEVIFSYHNIQNGNDRAWIYNLEYDSWWETDANIMTALYVYKIFSSAPPRVVGSVWTVSVNTAAVSTFRYFSTGAFSDTTASSGIAASLQTGLYDYGTPALKQVERVGIVAGPAEGNSSLGTTQATFGFRLAGTENPCQPSLTFSTSQTITATATGELLYADVRLTDRWIAYRLTHSAANETCEVHSLMPFLSERSAVRKRRV